jgi:hypothetical protein
VLAATVLVAAIGPVLAAGSADATTYRYWTYWWGSGTGKTGTGWTFASAGPDSQVLADTGVVGWRFATTSTVGGAKPRQSATFAELCPQLSAPVVGSVRVALVVDYGTLADAPPGQQPPTATTVRVECLTLPLAPRPTGTRVLDAVPPAGIPTRIEKGLVCALDDYPVGECAPVVAAPAPTTAPPTAGGTPAPTPSRSASPTSGPRSPAPASASTGRATVPGTTPTSGAAAGTTAAPTAAPTTGASAADSAASGSASAVAPSGPAATGGADITAGPAEETLPAVSGAPVAAGGADDPASPVGLAVGALAIAALGGAAWWTTRGGRAS